MNTYTVTLTASTPTQDTTVVLSPPDFSIKGTTNVTLNMYGIDETAYPVLSIVVDWGDDSPIQTFTKDIIKNYETTSIFDEMIYGKINGTVASTHDHVYQYTGDGTFDNAKYNFTVAALFENGYTITFLGTFSLFKGSFYDDVGGFAIHSTQISPNSTNDTIVNLEAANNAYTFIGVLSS